MRSTVLKATLAGIGVYVLSSILFAGVLLKISHHELLRWILYGTPGYAACIAAYLSPKRKLLIGMSMALYGAVMGPLSTPMYEYFGLPVDYIGTPLETFVIYLVYCAIWAVVGSGMGIVLSQAIHRYSDRS